LPMIFNVGVLVGPILGESRAAKTL
jgi:hypothetical protein